MKKIIIQEKEKSTRRNKICQKLEARVTFFIVAKKYKNNRCGKHKSYNIGIMLDRIKAHIPQPIK